MKIERNGKAKLNPKMAMNSANHRATRLRRQSTPPGPSGGGFVARGSVPSGSAQQLDDAVGRDRQPVDDRLRIALAQRVLDRVGDGGRDRDGAALARAFEPLGVGVGGCVDVDQV